LVLHTFHPAQKSLNLALKLEKKLGRVRNSEIGYQSRIIDIDVIAFDEEDHSDKLQVHILLCRTGNCVDAFS
jgi:7,8-dihydro-6-hydroxymethylpterin-pyrophosphokinase